ncbi:CAF1 family ribonuclease-domain-containing protein [Zopfochytrium polystomum]|nr:CAF1 family ribonuclease-domain-containing protein [Zopfochytrium polystomum]
MSFCACRYSFHPPLVLTRHPTQSFFSCMPVARSRLLIRTASPPAASAAVLAAAAIPSLLRQQPAGIVRCSSSTATALPPARNRQLHQEHPHHDQPRRHPRSSRRPSTSSSSAAAADSHPAMQIGRTNFTPATLSLLDASIASADFVSLDTEFTGLAQATSSTAVSDGGSTTTTDDDHPYTRARRSATSFALLQVGLCVFRWDGVARRYVARGFCFPVFPAAATGAAVGRPAVASVERTFLAQASSLAFLRRNGFDFNYWIDEGIPYLSREEERQIRAKAATASEPEDVPVDDRNREYIDGILSQIDAWLQTKTEVSLSLPAGNGFQRLLVHQQVRKKYNGFVATETVRGDGGMSVRAVRLTADERAERLDVAKRVETELNGMVGVRKVIDALSRHRKPLVGHNMLLDLCHTMHKFIGPLPASVEDFKKQVVSAFPVIYDTKYISHSEEGLKNLIERSVLEDLFAKVRESPFDEPVITIDPAFEQPVATASDSSSSSDAAGGGAGGAYHDAGFDAYVTGFAFLRLLAKAGGTDAEGRVVLEPASAASRQAKEDDEQANGAARRCKNKIHVMKADVGFMDFDGMEPEPDRSRTFHLTRLPATWRTHHVRSALQPAVGDSGLFHIKWLDSESCLVTLLDPPGAAATNDAGGGGGGGGGSDIGALLGRMREAAATAATAASAADGAVADGGGGGGGGGVATVEVRSWAEFVAWREARAAGGGGGGGGGGGASSVATPGDGDGGHKRATKRRRED